MNFLDAYDVSEVAATAPTRDGEARPEPSLNEEVSQVVGQLGRLWGGFRKQSQSVFESARKEVGQVVTQAQKELTKLSAEVKQPEDAPVSEKQVSEESPEAGPSSEGSAPTEASPAEAATESRHNRGPSVSIAAQNLFTRLQSALPSDLASTVQAKLPESIKQGAGSVDFAQLRNTLASEFQRVQGITRAQAEEYVHKSEELLRDAGEFLKEAVKVVPPEEGGDATPGVMWDGSDIWMLPEMGTSVGSDAKGKGKERLGRSNAEGLRAVATRAEALLKQLKHDPAILSVNPEADERASQMWQEWLKAEVDTTKEGIDGERWREARDAALNDPVDGAALKATLDTLVPTVLSSEIFWKRYFFRVHQVSQEEQRRKAILQGAVEEEDFDWESDDEDGAPSTAKATPADKTAGQPAEHQHDAPITPSTARDIKVSAPSTPASSSPRRSESEDGSYDVVSSQVSNNGEIKEEEHASGKESPKTIRQEKQDDEDSDWE